MTPALHRVALPAVRPTRRQRPMQHAEVRLQRAIDTVNTFFADEWPVYRSAVEEADLSIFEDYELPQIGQ